MKYLFATLILFAILGMCQVKAQSAYPFTPKEGQIVSMRHAGLIFGLPWLDAFFRGATESDVTHQGIITKRDGVWKVVEAVGPNGVGEVTLDVFMQGAFNNRYMVHEFDPYSILPCWIPCWVANWYAYYVARSATNEMRTHLGKPYDMAFLYVGDIDGDGVDDGDAAFYCSELANKGYKKPLGVPLVQTRPAGDLNYDEWSAVFQQLGIPRYREVIAPDDLLDSRYLKKVYFNWLGDIHYPEVPEGC